MAHPESRGRAAVSGEVSSRTVASAAAGRQIAFERDRPRVRRALRAFTFGLLRDRDAMDDVLQDVYLKAYRGCRVSRREPPQHVALRIAYTTCMSASSRVRSGDALRPDLDEAEAVSPEDLVEQISLRGQLAARLATLPPELRACLLLVHREGLSYEESATILGIAPGTGGLASQRRAQTPGERPRGGVKLSTVEHGFDQLLALETAPPEHREDFAQRLSLGLHEIDRERGLAHPRRPRTRRAVLLAVALLAVVVGVPALLLGGSSTAPTPSDLREIRSTIQRWEAVEFLPWPPTHYSLDRLPQGVHKRMAAEKLAVAEAVGTGEFVASSDVTRDQAGTLEQFRKERRAARRQKPRARREGELPAHRARRRRGRASGRLARGGDGSLGQAAGAAHRGTRRIDGTPVYEYTVRRVRGRLETGGQASAGDLRGWLRRAVRSQHAPRAAADPQRAVR